MGGAEKEDQAPESPARRPATFDELRRLHALAAGMPSNRVKILLVALLAGFALVGVIAAATGTPPSPWLMYGGFGGAAVLFASFLAMFVRGLPRHAAARRILREADPTLAPAVPLAEGDRLGGWVTLKATAERLHVARAQSLAAFRLARAGSLLVSVSLLAGTLGFTGMRFSSSGLRASSLRMLTGGIVGAWWLGSFALRRAPYQWTVEDGALVLQDAALFGASRLVTLRAGEIGGFEADGNELRVRPVSGATRPLASLGGAGTPLAGWRASSAATTIAVLMDLRTELTYREGDKPPTVVRLPAEFADSAELSPSTAAMLGVRPEAGPG